MARSRKVPWSKTLARYVRDLGMWGIGLMLGAVVTGALAIADQLGADTRLPAWAWASIAFVLLTLGPFACYARQADALREVRRALYAERQQAAIDPERRRRAFVGEVDRLVARHTGDSYEDAVRLLTTIKKLIRERMSDGAADMQIQMLDYHVSYQFRFDRASGISTDAPKTGEHAIRKTRYWLEKLRSNITADEMRLDN